MRLDSDARDAMKAGSAVKNCSVIRNCNNCNNEYVKFQFRVYVIFTVLDPISY